MDVVAMLERDRPRFHQHGTAKWDSLPETLRLIQRLTPEGAVHTGDRLWSIDGRLRCLRGQSHGNQS